MNFYVLIIIMACLFILNFLIPVHVHADQQNHVNKEKNERPLTYQLEAVDIIDKHISEELTPERYLDNKEARKLLDNIPGGYGFADSQEIERTRGFNLKDITGFMPGVLVQPRFGAEESRISIRGSGLRNNFHVRGLDILVDGFSITNADGFGVFGILELLSAKRVEVYKGANSLRFGTSNIGGAINLVTKTGFDAAAVESRIEAGSFGFFKVYLASGGTYGPADIYIGGSATELYDNYREHSDQERRRLFMNAGYQLSDNTSVNLDLGYVRNREELPGALTFEEFKEDPRQADPDSVLFDERHDYDYFRTALTIRTLLSSTQAVEFNSQLSFMTLDHPLSFAVIDNDTFNMSSELRYLSASELFGFNNSLVMGIQFGFTNVDDRRFENQLGQRGEKIRDQVNRAVNFGFYIEDRFDTSENFSIITGTKLQYARRSVSDRFNEPESDNSDSADFLSFTPKAGFLWSPMDNIQTFGNISSAYEPPLLLELTSPEQIGGNLADLKAQKALQLEIGTRGGLNRIDWDISIFNIELWDEILNVNVQPFPGATFTIPRFRNIDRSRHSGIETGVTLILLDNTLSNLGLNICGDTLTLRTAYTYSRFKFVNDDNFGNNDLPGAPDHFIVSELFYDSGRWLWIAPSIESIPEGYYVNSENTVRTEPYILFNFRAGMDHAPWNLSLFFEARNIADKNYISSVIVDSATERFFEPGDGRAFYIAAEWRWH